MKGFCFKLYIWAFAVLLVVCSCRKNNTDMPAESSPMADSLQCLVEDASTDSLIILYPKFSKIDLTCGHSPSKSDSTVILFAEAAYTGQCLKEFNHFNIAGDHVSAGKRYHGYKCKRNTGAFVYYKRKWKFLHSSYSAELDSAASNGGAGFAQELLIHNGKQIPTTRKDNNENQFRALCEIKGRLCVVESKGYIQFGFFRHLLETAEATEAIYLDMGAGWNYAWYRPNENEIVDLHPQTHPYCTNWITFYK